MKRLDENNRTERFWTASILTSLITDNEFAGVSTFLNLLKDPSGSLVFQRRPTQKKVKTNNFARVRWGYENFQISAELWYARDFSKNTEFAVPDLILLLQNKYLIVCEAKFFQQVRAEKIKAQIDLQKKTIDDILANHNSIEFVHHSLIYGGSEQFTAIEGLDSIITWQGICKAFQKLKGNNNYFVRVLSEAIKEYKKEFPNHAQQANYYTHSLDFIDLIAECKAKQNNVFVGLGTGGSATDTLESLIAGAKEELEILKEIHQKSARKFMSRPNFLKQEKYSNQSSLEYLFKHSNQRYKVDYADDNGSGVDKSNNPKWIDGNTFIHLIRPLLK